MDNLLSKNEYHDQGNNIYDGYVLPDTLSQLKSDLIHYHTEYNAEFGSNPIVDASVFTLDMYMSGELVDQDCDHVLEQLNRLECNADKALNCLRLESSKNSKVSSKNVEILGRKYNYLKNMYNIIVKTMDYK